MDNVKFSIGNRILIISRWYTSIRFVLNALAGITLVILSYALDKEGKIMWNLFWIGFGVFIETILVLMLRYLLYGFGIIVCNSAYNLSEKRVVTYLDYIEAKKKYKNGNISEDKFKEVETEYFKNDSGLI